MRRRLGHALELLPVLEAHRNAGRAAAINDALQLQVAALARDGDVRDALGPRPQRLAHGVNTVDDLH
jgi:hypothetical protein